MGKEYVIEASLPLIEHDSEGNPYVMTPQQRNKAANIIRNWCGDCDREQGELPLGCPCPQCTSYTVLCRYFRHVLLKAYYIPGAAALEADIFKGRKVKLCKECGKPFTPASNRAKYCHDCTERVRRQKKAATMRKQRSTAKKEG